MVCILKLQSCYFELRTYYCLITYRLEFRIDEDETENFDGTSRSQENESEETGIDYYSRIFAATNNGAAKRRHNLGWSHNKMTAGTQHLRGPQCILGPEYHGGKEPKSPYLNIGYSNKNRPTTYRKINRVSLKGPCHFDPDFEKKCIAPMGNFLSQNGTSTLDHLWDREKNESAPMPDVTQQYLDDEVKICNYKEKDQNIRKPDHFIFSVKYGNYELR